MKTITIEIKKAIAYQYYGCQYFYKNDYGTFRGEIGDFYTIDHLELPTFKLILKSLNTLTIKEAYTIADILSVRGDSFQDNNIQESIIKMIKNDDPIFPITNMHKYVHAVQYLQSQHYAMPYLNHSVNDLVEMKLFYIIPKPKPES